MKSNCIRLNSENDLELSNYQTICFNSEAVDISCVSGNVWITWSPGREKCLTRGDALVVESRSRICLQAFEPSRVRILSRPNTYSGILKKMGESAAGLRGLGDRAASFLNSMALLQS